MFMKDHPKALAYYREALEIWQDILPPDRHNLAVSDNSITALYEVEGYHAALSYCERSVNIEESSLPVNHPYNVIFRKRLERLKLRIQEQFASMKS
ncbi:unnamed protein product [Rotaria sp. Silwood2]|nr:unnamed protein product [Rotaria sp. Silwood2]CAF4311104.1 unnamed protein product [Rotaria sp. Silwood2]CAF4322761.1 unnamed protein product [Rotaria sp. Silwood2]